MVRRGLTQLQLAEAAGFSQPALSRRLRGEVPFDLIELDRIAAALDVTTASLLAAAS